MMTDLARSLHQLLANTKREDIIAILDAEDELTHAAAQLGLNAQAAANAKIHDACNKAIEGMPPYRRLLLSGE